MAETDSSAQAHGGTEVPASGGLSRSRQPKAVGNISSLVSPFSDILSTLEEFNDRLLQIERSFLLPAAYPRHSHSRHLLYGPDSEDSTKGTLFPHLVMAVKQARKRPISPALSYVRENLSLVLNAIRSATGILDKSLLLKGDPV